MFDDFEFELDPVVAGLAVIGGIVSLYVMKGVNSGLVIKLLSFVFTTALSYFIVLYIKNK